MVASLTLSCFPNSSDRKKFLKKRPNNVVIFFVRK